jgi:hypothetical protein
MRARQRRLAFSGQGVGLLKLRHSNDGRTTAGQRHCHAAGQRNAAAHGRRPAPRQTVRGSVAVANLGCRHADPRLHAVQCHGDAPSRRPDVPLPQARSMSPLKFVGLQVEQ